MFGQIKQARGFRQFSFRGLEKVAAEWDFVALTHNLLKLFRKGWRRGQAESSVRPSTTAFPLEPVGPRRLRRPNSGLRTPDSGLESGGR